MNACLPRSPQAIADVVAMVDPENNAELLPHDIDGDGVDETWCSLFIHLLTTLLGCQVPKDFANWQLEWLKTEGSAVHGWRAVTPAGAVAAAAIGQPVIVGWKNPEPKKDKGGKQLVDWKGRPLFKSGHIALVRATPPGEHGVFIAQAGRTNFALGPLIKGFGTKAPLVFFAHA